MLTGICVCRWTTAKPPLDSSESEVEFTSRPKRSKVTAQRGSGTARKACVSGLSVSRWKDQGNTSSTLLFQGRPGPRGAPKAGECSFTEPLSLQHKPSTVWSQGPLRGSSELLSSPVRVHDFNLSSMLADFTPNTHTWSRLKASLSVHRKKRGVSSPPGSSPAVAPPSHPPTSCPWSDRSEPTRHRNMTNSN
ncbi:unnamed protein product [Arctogadus glacialis]